MSGTPPADGATGEHAGRGAPELVAVVASAGGLDALTRVLQPLPADFPAALLVAMHLAPGSLRLVDLLAARCAVAVDWVTEGRRLVPGMALICPPQQLLTVTDGRCSLAPPGGLGRTRSLDHLLRSVAASFGERAVAVVLTGMGEDAAEGAAAVREAGGHVVVQTASTAAYPSMPHASASVASAVVELDDIAATLVALVRPARVV